MGNTVIHKMLGAKSNNLFFNITFSSRNIKVMKSYDAKKYR